MQRVICCLKEIPAGGKQSVRGELETELEHFALRLLKEGVSLDLYGTKEKEVDVLAFEDLRDCLFLTNDRRVLSLAKSKGAVCLAYCPPEHGVLPPSWSDFSDADMIVEGLMELDARCLQEVWNHARGIPCRIAEGTRIYLREVTSEDAPELYRIYHQSEVMEFVSEMRGSIEEEQEKLAAYQKNAYGFYGYGIWGICRKEDGRLLGSCGLEQREEGEDVYLELGYVLDPAFWGEGFASEAALLAIRFGKELGLEQIWAKIETSNKRSRAVAERIGMTLEQVQNENGREYGFYRIVFS